MTMTIGMTASPPWSGNGDVDGTGGDEGNLNPDQGAEAVGVADAERDQAGAGERPLPSAVRDVG